ncbi:ABC transporter permease [Reyranella sp. CPCC 100927]|uniref:ABC transporter permease n=1 Tax=Reyranella sp. CPCC 100927 TaxID=2599616 RepID=UPI0011B68CF4|nr:ABC transporter permease [Reyranella sp. CPCC 100927]TWT06043.1 ABC transporter permease [Reyranella sp. CPCC 100927]
MTTAAPPAGEGRVLDTLARSEADRRARRRWRTAWVWAARAIVLGLFVGLWQWTVDIGAIDPFFFSQPSAIVGFLVEEVRDGSIWPHVLVTLRETLAGFAIGAGTGVAAGIVRMQFPFVADVSNPFLTILNVLPRVALAPMFIIWFGVGEGSKVALAVSLVFFILMLNTEAGIRSLDRELVLTMRALGATDRQLFWKVLLPGAVPAIFGGLRLGVVYALLAVVVGEMISAHMGLGQRIAFHAASFRAEGVLGTILVLAVIGLGLNLTVVRVEQVLLRWRGDAP